MAATSLKVPFPGIITNCSFLYNSVECAKASDRSRFEANGAKWSAILLNYSQHIFFYVDGMTSAMASVSLSWLLSADIFGGIQWNAFWSIIWMKANDHLKNLLFKKKKKKFYHPICFQHIWMPTKNKLQGSNGLLKKKKKIVFYHPPVII